MMIFKKNTVFKKTVVLVRVFAVLFLMHENLFATELIDKSTVVTYPKPEGLQTSANFTVKVNNTLVWTEQVGSGGRENLHVANFSLFWPAKNHSCCIF